MVPSADTEAEAREMIRNHDGRAPAIVSGRIEAKLAAGDVDSAIHNDRVRRRVEEIEDALTFAERDVA